MLSFLKKKISPILEEFSTNFDSESVPPFLQRVSRLISSGFGDAEITKVCQTISKMQHDEERTLEFSVEFEKCKGPMKIHIFMDDIDSPDLAFFTGPSLCNKIRAEFMLFAEEKGI